jgi:dynein intermediate chain 2
MEIVHVYQKKRKEFGRQCLFGDRHAKLIVDINPDPELRKDYVYKNPNEVAIQCSSEFSEHEVSRPY